MSEKYITKAHGVRSTVGLSKFIRKTLNSEGINDTTLSCIKTKNHVEVFFACKDDLHHLRINNGVIYTLKVTEVTDIINQIIKIKRNG